MDVLLLNCSLVIRQVRGHFALYKSLVLIMAIQYSSH